VIPRILERNGLPLPKDLQSVDFMHVVQMHASYYKHLRSDSPLYAMIGNCRLYLQRRRDLLAALELEADANDHQARPPDVTVSALRRFLERDSGLSRFSPRRLRVGGGAPSK
jgi:hypothetical protein